MAVEADSVVIELIGRTSQLDGPVDQSSRRFERNMSAIERSATSAERTIVRSSGQSANAIRNFSFQVADVGVQFASGASPFLIIAQQGPQVVQALQDIKASGASLGEVMRGVALPGFLAVLSVLTPLISSLIQGADAADKKKDAVKSLTDAIDDMAKASNAAIASGQREIYVARAQADAYLQAAAAKRELIKAILQQRLTEYQGSFGTNTSAVMQGPGGGLAQGAYARNVADLQRQLAAQDKAVATAASNVQRTQAKVTQRLVAEAFDPVLKATGHYERQLDILNDKLNRGQLTDKQYAAGLSAITRERDAAVAATRAHTSATDRHSGATRRAATVDRDAAKAAREREVAYDQLTSRLDSLERQLDPVSAAAKDFAQQLKDIADGMEQGIITPARAAELRLLAVRKQLEPIVKQLNSIGKGAYKIAAKGEKVSTDDAQKKADDARDRAEQNIYQLADLYESLFTGGTKNLWEEFKRQGLRALALLAAQKTFELITGNKTSVSNQGLDFFSFLTGGSNIASGDGANGLGKILGGIFGRASGGYVGPRSLHRVNEHAGGIELLRMGPQGGEVIPLGQTKAASPSAGGGTRIFQISVSADNSVTPAGFAAGLASQILQEAQKMDAKASRLTLNAVPARIGRYQRDGT